ncbi:MAG TPA: hypothetical protein G4O16_06050 [Dehalococcoidia bacterium]|nr:hypothetical protein [Dehalococcoidia bacterium]
MKALLSRGLIFISHRLFVSEDYYIVVSNHKDIDKEVEVDYLPKVDDHCWRMISTNQQLDELIDDGFEFGAYELNLRSFLDKGAVAVCNFVVKELAHFSVFADNPRGKEVVEPLPFKVDFEKGQIVVGRGFTISKFRRLHFRRYNGYLIRKYLHPRGITGSKYPLQVNNYPSLVSASKSSEKLIISRCRFIKILWFKYFKETEIKPTPLTQIVAQMNDKIGNNK